MELPNYGKQLLQQLHSLCKEQWFSDCTIFVGVVHFRAHKIVLAASSLLFKSLLESTDTISIDASMLTPEEFALLLEMVYTGKLPPGKHNFTKIISVADSLQMFDVAVSCKNLLTDLMNRSAQGNVRQEVSAVVLESPRKEAPVLLQTEKASKPQASIKLTIPPAPVAAETVPTLGGSETADAVAELKVPGAPVQSGTAAESGTAGGQMGLGTPGSEKVAESRTAATPRVNDASGGSAIVAESGIVSVPVGSELAEAPAEPETLVAQSRTGNAVADPVTITDTLVESVTAASLFAEQDVSRNQEAAQEEDVKVEVMSTSGSPKEDLCVETLQISTAKQEAEETQPPEKKRRITEPATGSESVLDFLVRHEGIFSKALSETPTLIEKVSDSEEISEAQKQLVVQCVTGEPQTLFQRLVERVKAGQELEAQTVLSVLELCKSTHQEIETMLLEREPQSSAALQSTGPGADEHGLFQLLLQHKEELIHSITELSPIIECLDTAEEGFLTNQQKQVILDCCEGRTHHKAMEKLLSKVVQDKSLNAESLLKLLRAVREAFPALHLLLDTLEPQGKSFHFAAQRNPEDYGTELLRQYHENLAEILTDPKQLLKGLSAVQNLAPKDREVMEGIVQKDGSVGTFSNLVSAVLDEFLLPAVAMWQVLLAIQKDEFHLNVLMEEIRKEPGADHFFQTAANRECVARDILLRHSELIGKAISESPSLECVLQEEEGLTQIVKELISVSAQKADDGTSAEKVLSAALERSVSSVAFCQLLCCVHDSFPDLWPVMQDLEQIGILTEGTGEVKGIKKWKVNNKLQVEWLDKGENCKPEPSGKEEEKVVEAEASSERKKKIPQPKQEKVTPVSSRKSYVCKSCGKSFHFRCRLEVHAKRCRMARETSLECVDCNELKPSKKELEKHQQQVHGYSGGSSRGKKRRLLVTCDICGKEFAHPSGMQYHKRTEHFDEKPFSCSDCGAKFAANSTLKNHQRLHTGERPYVCKHCHMTFTQAAALAYHTKKKHSEGKMYVCQYCDAVFAQSIELTRHVRTHTGDKPYVCRECGKGFSQANGLSIHLRTFHNIEDPYDCQKCRMSFPSLDEHRQHIQEVHSREYHPCPTCAKIFSAPSLLERHMVTHVGGKPYNCVICDKAYQQLSGLWYHNRTHHPDVFAAQNHRSSKFSLQCSSCEQVFSSTTTLQKHVKAEHADVKLHECEKCNQFFSSPTALQMHVKCKHSGSQPFRCLYCSDSFRFPGALQHHVATEHFNQTESTFGCQICGELFTTQTQLEKHYEGEHPEVVLTETQDVAAQPGQAIQMPEHGATTEQVIALEETHLAGSQVIVALPGSQGSQASSELVAVSVEDLLDGTVTFICGETK
ncbi:zinc finger and BTB domain-containing protein 40-like [Microcaecilia unicolor]|uniref:Zinc finger and BTB domain-containing protein 40-like n=1 Tax=Microcaecilia unicolor TaxID=1415580 RepID=A0A6P7WN21_9AMPH|nr:zinc finger and BTB domain-containing protein 40-like [Microcaecilia unicolor]XP_030041724.1 zinc finger and BTB domain-containing protein 40-like [Microcaecilia unicolor]XP_030041725.1 zinc finger and BTB domain-containing protein 40-like [Microcaecilia unicolor]XP_030041726.1 zinc finger and BTB domain-containing protein 40-like [Microcaecilia unicolor]XP_030041727.1 zinc finger and BTB domain-containing protein 40-like [Microcaecilia unicolor]